MKFVRTAIVSLALFASLPTAPAQSGNPIIASPTSLNFGPVNIGASDTRQVSFRLGSDYVEYEFNARLTTTNPAFTLSRSTLTLSTSRRTVEVTFTPPAAGDYSADLVIETDEGFMREVRLSGIGVAGFTVTPPALDLGDTPVGCAATGLFTVDSPTASNFTVLTSDPRFVATPNMFSGLGLFDVTITARPDALGLLTGRSDITAAAAGTPATTRMVDLSVRGADVIPAPAMLDFGSVPVGTESALETLDLRLDTGMPTGLIAAATSDNPAFLIRGTGQADQIGVVFAPAADGPQAAMITVVLSSPADPVCRVERLIPVAGQGAPGDVTLSQSSLDFGTLLAGLTSAPMSVTVTSQATAAFDATVELTNPAYQVTPTTFNLPPGGSQTLDFTFAPLVPFGAPATATVNLVTAAGSAIALPVSLRGLGFAFSVEPGSYDFGAVVLDGSATAQFLVTNALDRDLAVDIPSTAHFTPGASALTIPARSALPVDVVFTPDALGTVEETIVISTEIAPGIRQAHRLMLTGEGVDLALRYELTTGGGSQPITPGTTIDFGAAGLGTSNDITLSIINDGGPDHRLESTSADGEGFRIVIIPGAPPIVPTGGQFTLTVRFTPTGLGAAVGSLSVEGAPFPLAGRGVLADVTLDGLAATLPARDVADLSLTLGAAPAEAVNGALVLDFSPAEGLPDDPAIQFPAGGRTANFTIPAGSTEAQFAGDTTSVAVQTGTVAGQIRVTAQFTSAGEDVGPQIPVESAGTVAAGPPVITSVAITDSSATGFTAVVTGFSTTRSVDAADFTFTGRSGVQVQPGQIGLQGAGELFGNWFGSEDSFPFGSAFTLTVPFTISGEPNAVGSVAVVLRNSLGASASVSANVP